MQRRIIITGKNLQYSHSQICKISMQKICIKEKHTNDRKQEHSCSSDEKLCLKAKVEAVCVVNGKLGDSNLLMEAIMNA